MNDQLKLRSTVGRDYDLDLDDVLTIKRALRRVGYY